MLRLKTSEQYRMQFSHKMVRFPAKNNLGNASGVCLGRVIKRVKNLFPCKRGLKSEKFHFASFSLILARTIISCWLFARSWPALGRVRAHSRRIFKLDFLRNQASNEQILFYVFHSFFDVLSTYVALCPVLRLPPPPCTIRYRQIRTN